MRRAQLSFKGGLIAAEVDDLRESWMGHADALLADEQLMAEASSKEPQPWPPRTQVVLASSSTSVTGAQALSWKTDRLPQIQSEMPFWANSARPSGEAR
jgi:hypothetical protein